MADNPQCNLCKTQMTKVGTLNSGNSRYITYRCASCHTEKTVCVGVASGPTR